jgi:DNA invertase Pin-like site-specific DNA recombinase
MGKLIGYRRVSSKCQGESGLGLAAQDKTIADYVKTSGCELVASYTEVESGKRSDRPELLKAIAHARRAGAKLVVAKLDRLSRNVAFLSALMESKVDFIACDNPHATPFTVHILAAVAEHEAKMISSRTREALAAYKAGRRVSRRVREIYPNGVPTEVAEATAGKLGASLVGSPLTAELRAKGNARSTTNQAKEAVAVYADLLTTIHQAKTDGLSLRAIAEQLNAEGHTTRKGNLWTQVQVMRLLNRVK